MTEEIVLRDVADTDLPAFFEQQLDPEANYMAAFTARNPADRGAFDAHWSKVLGDDNIAIKTIVYRGQVAGYVLSHGWFGDPEVSYWLGKEYWGKGIATRALTEFLQSVPARPLYARVVQDNAASLRVLVKCGFTISGEGKGFANGRRAEVAEFILTLSAAGTDET